MPNNPTALAAVTGASKRLGRIFALHLASRGYALMVHYRKSHRDAERLACEVEEAGGRAFLCRADLGTRQGAARLATEIGKTGLPLEVLVNSAAVMLNAGLNEMDVTGWDATFQLNLRAAWLCGRQAFLQMRHGLIVNISDVGAGKLWTAYPAYVVSKSALETLTRLQARAYAPAVRVNAIAPGLVLPSDELDAGEWERLVARLPLRRTARPEELCAALDFLLDNTYVTGQIITIAGGYDLV